MEPAATLSVLVDHTRQILSKNNSPDIGFDYSVNPYRAVSTPAPTATPARPMSI